MIHDTLQLIVNQLNASITDAGKSDAVILGNIAQMEGETKDELKKVIVTLVNVEEEASLKNGPNHRTRNGKILCENRPIHLYLYLLFSANLGNYKDSLKRLGEVIEFFQGKNVFNARNSPHLEKLNHTAEELAGFSVSLELFSLTFEQINHLWGSLGGKQVPFVLYRARLISLTANQIHSIGSPITEISLTAKTSYLHHH
jgi:hypothetical protein